MVRGRQAWLAQADTALQLLPRVLAPAHGPAITPRPQRPCPGPAAAGTSHADWGWRLSLGLALIPSTILTLGGLLLPDSPASLEERGRPAEARRVLERVRGTANVEAGVWGVRTRAHGDAWGGGGYSGAASCRCTAKHVGCSSHLLAA